MVPGSFPRWVSDALIAAGFVTLLVFLLVVAFTDGGVATRLAAAGPALGSVAAIVALGTAAIAVQAVNAQHQVLIDDHARQHNTRTRDLYADILAHAATMAAELRTDLANVHTRDETTAALLRAKDELNGFNRMRFRIEMTDRNIERRTQILIRLREQVYDLRNTIHRAIIERSESGGGGFSDGEIDAFDPIFNSFHEHVGALGGIVSAWLDRDLESATPMEGV